jgi:hypothetical protein
VTPAALLADLRARGVLLVAEGATLRWRAPAGVLTDIDKDALAAAKPALLALLSDAGKPPETPADSAGQITRATVEDVLRVFPDARVVVPVEAADDTAPATGRHPYGPSPPAGPCSVCGGLDYHRAGDGWTCSCCHPDPGTADGPKVTGPRTLEALAEQLYAAGEAVGWPTLPLGQGVTLHAGPTAWARFLNGVGPEWLLKVRRALEACDNGHPEREPGEVW